MSKEVEQRVFKNNGKLFEEDFKASFPSEVWAYRPPDTGGGMMARFTQESLCDLITYNTESKEMMLFELKSTLGTSVNFRPYDECMAYEKARDDYYEWDATLTPDEKRKHKDKRAQMRKDFNQMYKKCNQAMIKYHQIRDLMETREKYNIQSFIAFTFFQTSKTFVLPIESFVEFWKNTSKKSINQKDLEEMVDEDKCILIPQEYRGRSMRSDYDLTVLY